MKSILERFGLHRPELRAWALYDWANSAFWTTIIAAVFPIYFARVAAADLPPAVATTRFATATTLAMVFIALLSPVLGALADYAGLKMKMLGAFLGLGVAATGAMVFLGRGDWELALVLFVLGNVGVTGTLVFYESLLPHVAREDERDMVASAGFALGYLGGGLLLALNLLWIQKPELFGIADATTASRLSFLSVAVWWLGFSLPLFRNVREPERRLGAGESGRENPLRAAFSRLRETFRELTRYRDAFLMLAAFLVYNDGILTIIRMATSYGTEVGLDQSVLISALLITQVVGIPFAFLFGWLAKRITAKRAILLALVVYAGISIVGYRISTASDFYLLAILVGTVQGGAQALSRSLFSTLIPAHKSAEFFAFFGVFDKFAGIFGPALFAITIAATGSSRNAVLSVIAFFVVGAILLSFVNVEKGRRVAREAEASLALPASRSRSPM
ncbi:MAG TPA: MFS transporter [Vicinamibacteria bacterium]